MNHNTQNNSTNNFEHTANKYISFKVLVLKKREENMTNID